MVVDVRSKIGLLLLLLMKNDDDDDDDDELHSLQPATWPQIIWSFHIQWRPTKNS